MDQFQAARLKHAKNLERKQRTQSNMEVVQEQSPVVVELPKEQKASKDAVIDVVVTMPHRTLSFSLKRRDVLNNVHPNRLTKEEFVKAIAKGLEPLMGRVE